MQWRSLSSALGEGGGHLRPAQRADRRGKNCCVILGVAEDGLKVVQRKAGKGKAPQLDSQSENHLGKGISISKGVVLYHEEWLTLLCMESEGSHIGRDHHVLVLQGMTATFEAP